MKNPKTTRQRVNRAGRITAAAVLVLCAVWTAATKLNADGTGDPSILPLTMGGSTPDGAAAPAAPTSRAPRADMNDVLTLAFGDRAPPIHPRLALLLDELDVEGLPMRVALGGMPSETASFTDTPAGSDCGANCTRFAPPPRAALPGGLAGVGPGRSTPEPGSGAGTDPESSHPGTDDPQGTDGRPGATTPGPQPEQPPLPDAYPELPPPTPTPNAPPPAQVPEPGSITLLAAGLFGIFWLRRRSIRLDP